MCCFQKKMWRKLEDVCAPQSFLWTISLSRDQEKTTTNKSFYIFSQEIRARLFHPMKKAWQRNDCLNCFDYLAKRSPSADLQLWRITYTQFWLSLVLSQCRRMCAPHRVILFRKVCGAFDTSFVIRSSVPPTTRCCQLGQGGGATKGLKFIWLRATQSALSECWKLITISSTDSSNSTVLSRSYARNSHCFHTATAKLSHINISGLPSNSYRKRILV